MIQQRAAPKGDLLCDTYRELLVFSRMPCNLYATQQHCRWAKGCASVASDNILLPSRISTLGQEVYSIAQANTDNLTRGVGNGDLGTLGTLLGDLGLTAGGTLGALYMIQKNKVLNESISD